MPVSGNGRVVAGLGGDRGYGETALPRSDDGSMRFDFSAVFEDGLNYFGVQYDARSVFVNTNGTLSFLSAFADYPEAGNLDPGRDIIALFWGDVDTRLDGEGAESGAIWIDVDTTRDMVSITWLDVGVYRRNAEQINRFQLQIADRGGGDFDLIFRYEAVGWTLGSGALDDGARAGLIGSRLLEPLWIAREDPGEGAALRALPRQQGNTGVAGLWVYEMRDGSVAGEAQPVSGTVARGGSGADRLTGTARDDVLIGFDGGDLLIGGDGHDNLDGGLGADTLRGGAGRDTLYGGDGTDTIEGGEGPDLIEAGDTELDRRDVVYGGAGNDTINGGYGNDELRGDAGSDVIAGGFGGDTVIGGEGADTLTGAALGDEIYGGDGWDFLNGGFGHDRLNGGAGGDRFFHLGIFDHGSDWVQDYDPTEGDVLVFGGQALRGDFQINLAQTTGAGAPSVEEAFVIYRPTGQILWALVDGAGVDELALSLGGVVQDIPL